VTASGPCHPALRSQRISALWCAPITRGLDYQFAGGFLIGLQGDYAWMDAVGPLAVSQPAMNKNSDAFTRVICEYWPSGLPSVHRGARRRHRPASATPYRGASRPN